MPISEPVVRLPRGLQHVLSVKPNKFAGRLPSRLPHGTTKYVQPRDRIRKWNIRPGDKVRMMVGTPKAKFINQENSSEGWKVYTVKQVDLERGRVYLEGLNNIKGNVVHPRPDNYDSLPADRKKTWDEQKNFLPTMRPVHYSNVQLCLEDNGAESTFASRIGTSSTHFSKQSQRLDWRRFAAKISGGPDTASLEGVEGEDGLTRRRDQIPWPKPEKPYDIPKANTHFDTENARAEGTTLSLFPVSKVTDTPAADLFPQHINAPPPSLQAFTDEYIRQTRVAAEEVDEVDRHMTDMVMPLFLSEELAPRFAKGKMYKAYRARREFEALERDTMAREAVRAWEEGGRDRGLEEAMGLESVRLEGVYIKSRTREEVRQASEDEYDAAKMDMRKEVNTAVRGGKKYDVKSGEWVEGEKAKELRRKRERRERKERKTLEKLQNLSLSSE